MINLQFLLPGVERYRALADRRPLVSTPVGRRCRGDDGPGGDPICSNTPSCCSVIVLSIAVLVLMRVRAGSFVIRSPPGLPEHPAQVDGHLLIDVFARGSLEYFCLGSQVHSELAVVFAFYGPQVLEQRQDLAPLDVPARRVPEDLLDRHPMMTAQVRVHCLVLLVVPLGHSCHPGAGARSRSGSNFSFAFFAGSRMR